MDVSCDLEVVQVFAIMALAALGMTAIIVDGEVGNTIAIAVSGGIGYLARSLFMQKDENNQGGEL